LDELLGEETLGGDEILDESKTLGADDAEAEGVLGDSILDIFEAEESEDEALGGLANGLEDIDIIELIERCSVVLEQFEARS